MAIDKITVGVNCNGNDTHTVNITLHEGVEYSSVEYTCWNISVDGVS